VWHKMSEEAASILSSLPKDILIHCILKTSATAVASRTCVKVGNLRKLHGPDVTLEKWLLDPNNVYVGRHGRIFIDKEIFHYPGSKWANPYPLKKYTLDESLELYRDYITSKIEGDPNYNLSELRGKNMGCWCDHKDRCHVDVLLSLLD